MGINYLGRLLQSGILATVLTSLAPATAQEKDEDRYVYSDPVCAKLCQYIQLEGQIAGDSRFCRLITFANECYAKEAEADILYGGQCEGREDLRRPWEDLPCYVEKYGKNWRQIISKYEGNLR